MKKFLLVFPYHLQENNGFESIISRFEKNNYIVHIFPDISNETTSIDILPLIVNSICDEQNAKIVLLSNIKDLLFIWFRAYNSLIDDFIYFIDIEEKNLIPISDRDYSFYSLISNFQGIHSESIQGKIYINININNYYKIFRFLFHNCNFLFFDSIDNYPYELNEKKLGIVKKYLCNDNEYLFEVKSLDELEIVNIQKEHLIKNELQIKSLNESPYFILYLFIELYRQKKERAILNIVRYLHVNVQKLAANNILQYIRMNRISFLEKISFFSILVMMQTHRQTLLKEIMNTILNDDKHIKYHYPLITSSLFYQNRNKLQIYINYFKDRKKALERIINNYSFKIKPEKKPISKRIAVLVDQLLGFNHSPTKIMIDHVVGIKKLFPDYEVKIFVEENFISHPTEIGFPYYYSASKSVSIASEHQKYLGSSGVDVYYSDVEKPKVNRTLAMIKEVLKFNPEVILTNSDISLARNYLYQYFPVAYWFFGETYCSSIADIYLHRNREDVVQENLNYGLLKTEHVYNLMPGINLVKSKKKFSRSNYSIDQHDFVLITVGNRLFAELDEKTITLMKGFLDLHKDAKWIVVGNDQNIIKTNEQIIKISYEKDLVGLYDICDVYINPIRVGGGHSIALAMSKGVPVVTLNMPSAGKAFVGKENSVNDLNEYNTELFRLYSDIDYRKDRAGIMKKLIKEYTMENTIRKLIAYLQIAKSNFNKRNI